jgi:hypothetical protein
MKITKRQLRRIIKEEKAKLLKEYGAMNKEIQSALLQFAQAYAGLGNAVQEQLIDLVNAHVEGRIEDAVYEMNPNALDMAFERLQHLLSDLARAGSEDAMDMMDAMEAAAEIFAEGDAEVDADARAAGDI